MMKKRELGREVQATSYILCRRIEYERSKGGLEDLGYLQAGIIRFLSENRERDIFPKDIVKVFSVTRSTVTGALKKMEKGGYLSFVPFPQDARLKKIVLTEKGAAIQHELHARAEKMERLLVKDMTAEEIDTLFRLLHKIQENLLEDQRCPGMRAEGGFPGFERKDCSETN